MKSEIKEIINNFLLLRKAGKRAFDVITQSTIFKLKKAILVSYNHENTSFLSQSFFNLNSSLQF